MIYTCIIDTPLGAMRTSAEHERLTGLWFTGQRYFPDTQGWVDKPDYEIFTLLRIWLNDYFAGKNPGLVLALNPHGSAFQQSVWDILQTIPYGKTTSYSAIAKQIQSQRGSPSSARAVGLAVGHNPISLVIPCHRVIGSDGSLTGYAGGMDKKKALLALESKDLGL
jgi:methylated-DNA-[protein]-cysteine S-methyltransferase